MGPESGANKDTNLKIDQKELNELLDANKSKHNPILEKLRSQETKVRIALNPDSNVHKITDEEVALAEEEFDRKAGN